MVPGVRRLFACRERLRSWACRSRFAAHVETLEGRPLTSHIPAMRLSTGVALAAQPLDPSQSPAANQVLAIGAVRKHPRFYEFYIGPKRDSLDVVAAGARLFPGGTIVLSGATHGEFVAGPPAIYVFGIDRNGHLPPGPFPGRPNIRFDALVVVTLKSPPAPPTTTVMDLQTGKSKSLPQNAITFKSRQLFVELNARLLPSRGLPADQYRVNFWARSSMGKPNLIASFVPESTMFQIGPGLDRTPHL